MTRFYKLAPEHYDKVWRFHSAGNPTTPYKYLKQRQKEGIPWALKRQLPDKITWSWNFNCFPNRNAYLRKMDIDPIRYKELTDKVEISNRMTLYAKSPAYGYVEAMVVIVQDDAVDFVDVQFDEDVYKEIKNSRRLPLPPLPGVK